MTHDPTGCPSRVCNTNCQNRDKYFSTNARTKSHKESDFGIHLARLFVVQATIRGSPLSIDRPHNKKDRTPVPLGRTGRIVSMRPPQEAAAHRR